MLLQVAYLMVTLNQINTYVDMFSAYSFFESIIVILITTKNRYNILARSIVTQTADVFMRNHVNDIICGDRIIPPGIIFPRVTASQIIVPALPAHWIIVPRTIPT